MKVARKTDTPWLAALTVALLYLAVLWAQLSLHNQDPSYFIHIGDKYVLRPDKTPKNIHIFPDSTGYDGQFFYQLALNPFSPQAVNAGLMLDNGSYRHQRILYPLLAWLLSFGNRDFIPAMLVMVNYLALCGIAWLGGRYAQLHQRHALWGCLFSIYPGFLFTMTRDLTEIISVLFLLAGLISLQRSPSRLHTTIFLTMAVLTRETTLIAVLALGFALILRKEYWRWPIVATPIAVFGAWQVLLWIKWGKLPVLTAGLLLGIPGNGVWAFIKSLEFDNGLHRIWMIELVYLAVIAIAALVAIRAAKDCLSYKLMWASYGILVLAMTQYVWTEDIAFMRASSEFYLFSFVLIVAAARSRLLIPTAVSTLIIWTLVFFTRLSW